MMKKSIRSVALILALVMAWSFPASADDYADPTTFNVLEYSFPDGGTTSIDSSSPSVFELPFDPYSIKYIDMLVYCPSAPTFTLNGEALTSSYLGNWIYRVYGRPAAYVGSSFSLDWSGPAYVEYYSVRISTVQSYNFVETGTMEVSGGGLESNYNQTMSSSTSAITCTYPSGLENDWYSTVKFYSTDWRLYDYVDFYFHIFSSEINSIDCFVNNRSIPFEVTEIYADSDFTSVYCSVRMDLRNVDRSSYYTPIVSISLLPFNTSANSTSYVRLLAVTGSIVTDPPDPNMLYFSSLEKHLSVLFASMAQRQDAYHADQTEWYQEHTQVLNTLFESVNSRLTGISSGIQSLISTVNVGFGTLWNNLDVKLSAFQSSMESWFSTVSGKLDQLIGGTTDGDELSQGADDLEDQISDIHDYEQSQQEILDNSLPEIQQAVTFTRFTAALAFVQRYINLGWSGIGDLSIIYTLPIFIGLFFFICGRVSGRTRVKQDNWPKELPGQESWF